jgi:hypothetical protein
MFVRVNLSMIVGFDKHILDGNQESLLDLWLRKLSVRFNLGNLV